MQAAISGEALDLHDSLASNNKFLLYFHAKLLDWLEQIDDLAGNELNKDYCPTAVKHLARCLPKLQFLTGLMGNLRRYANNNPDSKKWFDNENWPRHFTNVPVECWHKNVKNDILMGKLKRQPSVFISKLEEAIEYRYQDICSKLTCKNDSLRRSGIKGPTVDGKRGEEKSMQKKDGMREDKKNDHVASGSRAPTSDAEKTRVARELFKESEPPAAHTSQQPSVPQLVRIEQSEDIELSEEADAVGGQEADAVGDSDAVGDQQADAVGDQEADRSRGDEPASEDGDLDSATPQSEEVPVVTKPLPPKHDRTPAWQGKAMHVR